jgi:signal transduction histidine kinase
MLGHTRGKTGQRELVNLNNLIDEALQLTYHSYRAKVSDFFLTLKTDFDPSLEPLAVVPADLSRVIVNIANNACYATEQKRKQSGSTYIPLLRVTTRNQDNQVALYFWDNGIGLTPEVKEKMFNPFFTTKPPGEGAGLGLSISYDIIVQGHQGQIEVTSMPERYTEFIITLPKLPQ